MKNVVFTSGLKKAGLVALMALLLGTTTAKCIAITDDNYLVHRRTSSSTLQFPLCFFIA